MSRIMARVSGIVQGVGFRYFVIRKATAYGLRGYVRNCFDGDVEVEAEGDKLRLEQLIEDLGRGPICAKVKNVQTEWFDDEKGYRTFTLET